MLGCSLMKDCLHSVYFHAVYTHVQMHKLNMFQIMVPEEIDEQYLCYFLAVVACIVCIP